MFPSIYSLSRVYEHKANNKLLQTRTAATPRQPPLSYHERVSQWSRQAASISSLSGLSLSLTLQGCSLILATRILPRSSLCRPSVRPLLVFHRSGARGKGERKKKRASDALRVRAPSDRHTGQPGLEGAGARSLALLGYQNRLRARGATPLYTLAPSLSLPPKRAREKREGGTGGSSVFWVSPCSALLWAADLEGGRKARGGERRHQAAVIRERTDGRNGRAE